MFSIYAFVRMHVNWKALYACAGLFWLAMCAVEYVYGAIIRKGEFSKIPEVEEYIPVIVKKQAGVIGYDSRNLIFWGMLSMTSSLCVFIFIKLVKLNYKRNREPTEEILEATGHNSIANEESLSIDEKDSQLLSDKIESKLGVTGTTLLDVVKDFPVTTKQNEIPHRPIEKRLTKTDISQEQHLALVKEFTILTKKFENAIKDKKDLLKKLGHAEKDSKEAKQQLQEITGNRSLLIKKLESATREIKLNTKTKKDTMHKLEEAVECSNMMKHKLIELTNDNIMLADKIRKSEAQYKSLQEHAAKLQQQQQDTGIKVKDASVSSMSMTMELIESEQELDACESEKEIEKVQSKLQDLEKSLELMRLSVKSSEEYADSSKTLQVESEIITPEYVTEYEYENYNSNSIPLDPVLKEIDEIVENRSTIVQYEDDETETEKSLDLIFNSYDTSTDYDSKAGSVSSFSQTTLGSEYEYENETHVKGIVSQSPAFQKFLLTVYEH